MKTRILTALVGLLVLTGVLIGFYTPFVVEAAVALLAMLSVYELLKETKLVSSVWMFLPAMLLAGWIPFSFRFENRAATLVPPAVLVVYLLLLMLARHEQITFMQVACTIFAAVVLPLCYSSLLIFRDLGQPHGIFYTLIALGGAWFSDIGGYFIGRKFGRHKLAPKVSPKKSVEGVFGGVVFVVLGTALIGFLYGLIYNRWFAGNAPIQVHYGFLIAIGLLLTPVGILGDLCASVIKRQTQIKDFGIIMPGHGGILDRFDSALWTMTAVAIFLLLGGRLLFPGV